MTQKQLLIVDRNALVDPVELFSFPALPGSRSTVMLHRDAVALGHTLHRLGEREMVVIHEKVKDAAAGLTTETMVDALFLTDREGWGFLGVEWAQAHVIAAGLF